MGFENVNVGAGFMLWILGEAGRAWTEADPGGAGRDQISLFLLVVAQAIYF
jgi:hypothetical protein